MDAKITKNRLSRLLTYDWVKILAVVIALIVGWTVLFNSTATKIRPSQRFTVINYYANDYLSDDFSSLLNNAYGRDKVFSYETLELGTPLDLNEYEVSTGSVSLLESRFATADGDIMFVPSTPYTGDMQGVNFERTFAENFLNRFYGNVYKLDDEIEKDGPSNRFFVKFAEYLNKFYEDGYENKNSLNLAKVEENFRARIKAKNDKRFRSEALIKAGLPAEIERIKKYRDALEEFNSYLHLGVITIETMTIKDDKGSALWTGKTAINLCPDESKMDNLKKYLSYTIQEEYQDDETGETLTRSKKTAKNMYAMILYHEKVETGYEFESVLFLNYLIKNSITINA